VSPVFNPITSERKLRTFGVLDLEWVPGEALPELVNAEVEVAGVTQRTSLPLPVSKRATGALGLRLCGYYDHEPEEGEAGEVVSEGRYRHFSTVRDFLASVLVRETRGMWFFAHAGGLADMQFVLDEILTEIKAQAALAGRVTRSSSGGGEEVNVFAGGQWTVRASFSGSSAIIVHVQRGKHAWHFVDSYWLLRDKLANIGRAIGVKKGDDPRALDWMSRRFGRRVDDFDDLSRTEKTIFYAEVPIDILILYNRIDCEILWKAIAAFEDEIVGLGGQLQQTIASTAMGLFRRAYLKRDIFTSERLNQICSESYFASRVEVLQRDAEDFWVYDINSSFPHAMTSPLPGNLTGYQTRLPDDDSDECIYLADVTVEVPDTQHVPPLPYRKQNRVFFPTGRWRSWFTSTDVRLALREGARIHKVHEVYLFEPFHDFAEYAKTIYALRAQATTKFRKLVLKYLLNSLYGKCSESTEKQEMLINPEEVDRTTMQMLQPGVWLADKTAKIAHRHVIVASVITAVARRTLYDYIKECERQGCPIYYCDTDSLATKADLPVDDKTLGALKLEKKMEWAEFVAPKIYRGEGFELQGDGTWTPKRLTKAKGFSLGRGGEAWEKLDRIIAGDRVAIQRMTRMRELYRTQVGGQYTTSPFEVLVVKALTFEMLSKRYHYPDGHTRPWTVEELRSGDRVRAGFDFGEDEWAGFDAVTRAMLRSAV
jgi:hypothetical protein